MKWAIIGCLFIGTLMCSCKSKGNLEKKGDMHFQSDQVLIDLADEMNPKRIEASFGNFGLKYLCTIDKEKNNCVFYFDTNQKNLAEMMTFLEGEVGVENVQKTSGCQK